VVGGASYLALKTGATQASDGSARLPDTSASKDGLAQQAAGYERNAALAIEGGDYSAAMSAAKSLRDVALRADASANARAGWLSRADSIADVIASACPVERAMRARRDVSAPPCPPRAW
jgi:hypothetical protein